MSPMLIFILAGLGTFAIRYSAVALISRGFIYPDWLTATLRMVAPAVLSAIVANTLILDKGELSTRWSWYAAAVVGAFVSWRWRSPALTIVAGMCVAWSIGFIA
jgi:branched-subunit amino acid transport protein